MLKEEFGAKDPRSLWFRTAVQTAALPLTRQQPLNNIVRTTVQTLAAVLGGVQSIHTTSYDEAFALPSEESHELSIRIQQIIAYETGVTKTVDPLGGSNAVEWLTNKLGDEILALMAEIERGGGFIELFKKGWVDMQIDEARYERARQIESGELPVIGVNMFTKEEDNAEIKLFQLAGDVRDARIRYIKQYKERRDKQKVNRALGELHQQILNKSRPNLVPPVLQAVEAGATVGEISDTFCRAEKFEVAM